jgi:predicted alpha/beta hydrolase family esterase
VERLALPDPDQPAIDVWVPRIREALGGEAERARTILLGHSVGCMAAMRALDEAAARPVHALVCVAGWWTVDQPWPSIRPWIDAPLDTARVRANAPRVRLIVSDNDPFTSDHRATAARFERELGATTTVVPGGLHFNRPEEPPVLEAISALVAAAATGSA